MELHATCGAINLHSGDKEQRQLRRVAQVLVHPGYSSKSLINDVAVLIVDPPFEMTEYVGPVCLPDPDQVIQEEGEDLGLREDNNEEECDPIFEDCNAKNEEACDPIFEDCDTINEEECDPIFEDCDNAEGDAKEDCDPIFEDCDDTAGGASEELGLRGGEDKLVTIDVQVQM